MEEIEIKLLAPLKKDVDSLAWIDWKNAHSSFCPLNEKNLVWTSKIETPDVSRRDAWALAEAAAPESSQAVDSSRESTAEISAAISQDFQDAARAAASIGKDHYFFVAAKTICPGKDCVAIYYFQLLPAADADEKLEPEDFFYPDYLASHRGKARLAWLYSRLVYKP